MDTNSILDSFLKGKYISGYTKSIIIRYLDYHIESNSEFLNNDEIISMSIEILSRLNLENKKINIDKKVKNRPFQLSLNESSDVILKKLIVETIINMINEELENANIFNLSFIVKDYKISENRIDVSSYFKCEKISYSPETKLKDLDLPKKVKETLVDYLQFETIGQLINHRKPNLEYGHGVVYRFHYIEDWMKENELEFLPLLKRESMLSDYVFDCGKYGDYRGIDEDVIKRLTDNDILTIGQLVDNYENLLNLRRFGKDSLEKVKKFLQENNMID